MNKRSITIINDGNVRGVIAPSAAISEEMLEDIVELIELSDPKFVASINRGIRAAKREKLIEGSALRKKLGL